MPVILADSTHLKRLLPLQLVPQLRLQHRERPYSLRKLQSLEHLLLAKLEAALHAALGCIKVVPEAQNGCVLAKLEKSQGPLQFMQVHGQAIR